MKRVTLFLGYVLSATTSVLAATITVTNTNDTGAGSLRAAMTAAASGDTIVFSNTTAGGATNFYDGSQRTVALLTALPQFTKSVTLTGPGAGALTVARSSGNSSIFRIFIVSNSDPDHQQVTVSISGLTLSNGGVNTQLNPPFPNNAGGCILSLSGTLTLSDLRITGNAAPYGGGIASVGQYTPVTILRCTFDANSATYGGAIAVMDGSVSVSSSTFFNNSASTAGGGTYTGNIGDYPRGSVLTIYNSTFQTNSAPSGSAVYGAVGNGDGYSSYTGIASTILNSAAGASSALASGGGAITSQGYNLSSDNGGGFFGASTDQINTNPGFGIQGVSGGRIYFPLLTSSPAVDRGYNYSGIATDQIGQPRTNDYYNAVAAQDGDDTDIGAVELQGSGPNQQTGPTYTITNATTHNDGNCSPTDCTLPEAILAANGYSNSHASDALVLFSSSPANGATNFYDGLARSVTLTSALPSINGAVTIQGPGPNAVTIQRSSAAGTPDFRIFYLHRPSGSGPTVTIFGLSIANGKADYGGGIYNDGGNLTVMSCILQSNNSTSGGGAIYNLASLTVNSVVFLGNSAGAGRGGAILHKGAGANIANSTFETNSAGNGGAIANEGLPNQTTIAIDACTFTGNSASNGGGVYNDSTTLDINHSSFSGNSAAQSGGAVFTLGDFRGNITVTRVSDSTLYNNSAQNGGAVTNDTYLETNGYAQTSLTNCTLSGNSASVHGAGVFNRSVNGGIDPCPTCTYAKTFITSCTFNSNSTAAAGSAIYNTGDPYSHDPIDGDGGAEVLIADTILNGSAGSGVNIFDGPGNSVRTNGYNLSSDAGAGVLVGGSDHINTDPKLEPLQNNGGPTLTHALLADSPARDQGLNIADLSQDQRGMPRVFDYGGAANAAGGDGSDIGAFEDNDVLQSSGNLVVNSIGDWDDGFCGTTDCTLREAINRANLSHSPTTITFNLSGDAPHKIGLSTIANSTSGGSALLLGSVTIQGPGANLVTIQRVGSSNFRLFRIPSGAAVSISGLTISNGNMPNDTGGGILNQGTLTLQACAISGNSANSGGGIATIGTLTLDRCTVSGNSSYGGAGISSQTNLSGLITTLRNSTISGNSAANFGGGVENVIGQTIISNSTITHNTAPDGQGGGVFTHFANNSNTQVFDSIIAGNSNTDVDYVASGPVSYTSSGHNLVGCGDAGNAFSASGDMKLVANPKLSLLADHGGGTLTHALLLGSPAINAGAPTSVSTDQRGLARQSGSAVDIGAYELQPETYAFWSSYSFPLGSPAALTDPTADYDHDGISNGLEQALGLNPLHPDAQNLALQYEVQGGFLVLQFQRSITVDPAKIVGEESIDLHTWDSIGITYDDLGPGSSTTELIQALIPINGAAKKFGRLRYTP